MSGSFKYQNRKMSKYKRSIVLKETKNQNEKASKYQHNGEKNQIT